MQTWKHSRKIIIEALNEYAKRWAFDANMFRHGLASTSHAKNADKKLREIENALSILGVEDVVNNSCHPEQENE